MFRFHLGPLITSCLIILAPLAAFTQNTFLPAQLDEAPEIYLLPEADQMTLLIRNGSETMLYILDEQMVPIDQKIWRHDGVQPDWVPLGMHAQNGGSAFVYWDPKGEVFSVYQIDYQAAQQQQYQIRDARTRMERAYWGTFSIDGQLHMLRLARDRNQIRICQFGQQERLDQQVYTIDRPGFLRDADFNFTPIDTSETEWALTDTYAPGKLYQQGHTLLLTLDAPGETYLVCIDLDSQEKTELSLPYAIAGKVKGNSLLVGSALYQFCGREDSMCLTVNESLHPDDTYLVQSFAPGTELISSQGPQKQLQDGRTQSLYNLDEWLTEVNWAPHLAIGLQAHAASGTTHLLSLGGIKPFVKRGVTGALIRARYEQAMLSFPVAIPAYQPTEQPDTALLASKRITRLRQRPGFRSIIWQGQTWIAYPDGAGYQLERIN